MDKFLRTEFTERTTKDEASFREYLKFRKENDIWEKVPLKDVMVLGIPNEPLFQTGDEMETTVTKNDVTYPITLPLNEDAELCIREGFGIFLAVPSLHIPPTPVSYSGYNTLLNRAGIGGPVMTVFKSGNKKKALPVTKKQNILNDCFGLYNSDSQAWGWVLFRDGRIPAFNSSGYGIFHCWELCDCLEKQMKKEHPDFAFHKATVNEELLVVEYKLHDELANDRLLHQLQSFGMHVTNLDLGICLMTSDTGSSEVSIFPLVYMNGQQFRFGRSIGIRHSTSNDLKKYIDLLPQASALFDECEDRIEELGNTPIKNVPMTVLAVAESNAPFNKRAGTLQRQQIRLMQQTSGTAMDVFLSLYEMAEDYIKDRHIKDKLRVLEEASKLMFLDFTKYDA